MDNLEDLESKTTSGVFVHWIGRHAHCIENANDLQSACFHYRVARELHFIAGQLHSLQRMRPQGLQNVETALEDLNAKWEGFAHTYMDNGGRDLTSHESFRHYLRSMELDCWDWWGAP